MIVRRTELELDAKLYARDYMVERSLGCHLMQVVQAIRPVMEPGYRESPYTDDQLEHFALPGFLWEHVMDRAEQLELALTVEATAQIKRIRKLMSPGEMFWCRRCDEVMLGLDIAREHCGLPTSSDVRYSSYIRTPEKFKGNGHRGIFWTPDCHNDDSWPVEFKVTWLSSKRTGPTELNIWKYVTQTQWQAWGYEADGAEIYACFVNDDYSYPLKPKTYHFEVEYMPREKANCHSMIVSNAIAKGWI